MSRADPPVANPSSEACYGPPASPTVTLVAPSLWRVEVPGTAGHRVLVLVTGAGSVVVDPVSAPVARWISEWCRQEHDSAVRQVIYTHAHFDHIGGGGVLGERGAEIIAHRRAVEPIIGERLPTAVPSRTFDSELVLSMGGEEIRLTRVAPSHSNSMIIAEFTRQRLVLAADFCPVGRVPYNDFPDFYYDGWMESLEWLAARDFDLLDGGHWDLGTPADAGIQLDYMEHLHREVQRLVRVGQAWDELYRNVTLDDRFRSLAGFTEMRFANVLGMYRWVSQHRRGIY